MDKEALAELARAISHDLRAPLRAVDGYARMVLEDEGHLLSEDGRRKLGALLGAASQLSTQIDAVVGYLRIDVDPSRFAAVDMNLLVDEALVPLRSEGRLAGIKVEVAPLPPAFGDRAALRALWEQLLDNAAKFSSRVAAPCIRVSFAAIAGEGAYLVTDNGAGFDQAHAGKLFGLFKRLHYADEFPGVGAGLARCRRIVELHGGRIGARGKVGEGASVHFSLPGEQEASATRG